MPYHSRCKAAIAPGLLLLLACNAIAQAPSRAGQIQEARQKKAAAFAQAPSRAGQILEARQKKAAALEPEERHRMDKKVDGASKFMEETLGQGYKGVGLRFGGLPTGQGFALGPQFIRRGLLKGQMTFRTSAAGTLSKAYLFDMQASFPKLANHRLYFHTLAMFRNSPQMDYYGPGPESDEGGLSQYRFEETKAEFALGGRLTRILHLGMTGGYLGVNTGPGTSSGVPQASELYPDVPGMQDQTNYAHVGFFGKFDYLDNPLGPRSGGLYRLQWSNYRDLKLDTHAYAFDSTGSLFLAFSRPPSVFWGQRRTGSRSRQKECRPGSGGRRSARTCAHRCDPLARRTSYPD